MIYALHGFLGLPADWNFLNAFAVDVLSIHPPKEGMWKWAKAFNAFAEQTSQAPRILLGYSMGARLAMHALLDAPELWQSAIFVSGQSGLKTDEERAKKAKEDIRWAERFLHDPLVDPWKQLMRDWNEQSIFLQNKPFVRHEQDFARPLLAETILGFSQSLQEDLSSRLDACPVPQLWMAGECDAKYAAIARARPLHRIIPQAGHRVPWDNPDLFTKYLDQFLEEKKLCTSRN
ncbi:MAG: alpha/beta fold hydrolase [Parachlamydia sp.]|nr:alpha/beta fold hydrolase [Parachlamydia sp.]